MENDSSMFDVQEKKCCRLWMDKFLSSKTYDSNYFLHIFRQVDRRILFVVIIKLFVFSGVRTIMRR